MKLKIISVTTILFLVILVVLLFRIDIPLCYNTSEYSEDAFILYDAKIVNVINEQIKKNPFYHIAIIGNSMSPSIKNGDTCVCVPQEDYSKGDIVSFYVPEGNQVELIAHRIIKNNNNQFTTRGDNNDLADNWIINEDQIFCKIPEKNLFNKFKFAIESGGEFSIFQIIG